MPSSKRHCSVPGCAERNRIMFLFPKDHAQREEWRSRCRIERSISNFMLVCSRHFLPSDVYTSCESCHKCSAVPSQYSEILWLVMSVSIVSVSGQYVRLKKGAVPSQELPEAVKRKRRRNCIVHGCASDGALHFFPKNASLQKQWALACKMTTQSSRNTRICGDHFCDEDFSYIGM